MSGRLLDSPVPYFAAAALLVVVAVASQLEVRLPPLPEGTVEDLEKLRERDDLNVVLILVDTLRADHLDSYGYERETSPNLTGLAQAGIRFERVLAQSSWTKTSMASLWTATHPVNHGVTRFDDALPAEVEMPAERLKQAGFRTAGIFRNGWVAPNFGFDQGFDMYLRPRPGRERRLAQSQHPAGPSLEGTDEDVLTSAFEFIDAFGDERFFLYLHFMDVHQYVYDEDAPEFGPGYLDAYDQSIHWTDRILAHFYSKLADAGLLDRTLLVVTSDHGEAFREHGYEGHARNLFAEVSYVPWIIGLPFRLPEGIVVEEPFSGIDLWPTLFDLLGMPPSQHADGRSAVPAILAAAGGGAEQAEPVPQIAYLDRNWGGKGEPVPIVALGLGGKRFIWWPESDWRDREAFQLFDVESDPMEQENLYQPDDADAERLLAIAREHVENAASPWGADARQVELDEMRLNQLRALGYALPAHMK